MKDHLNDVQVNIDVKLLSSGQEAMKAVIRSLPDDTLSMTWRSALNEKLVAEAATKRKKVRVGLFLRPALGLGFASLLAVMVLFRMPSTSAQLPRSTTRPEAIEAAMVNTHGQTTVALDVAGVGLNPVDLPADNSTSLPNQTTNWSEDDLETL